MADKLVWLEKNAIAFRCCISHNIEDIHPKKMEIEIGVQENDLFSVKKKDCLFQLSDQRCIKSIMHFVTNWNKDNQIG